MYFTGVWGAEPLRDKTLFSWSTARLGSILLKRLKTKIKRTVKRFIILLWAVTVTTITVPRLPFLPHQPITAYLITIRHVCNLNLSFMALWTAFLRLKFVVVFLIDGPNVDCGCLLERLNKDQGWSVHPLPSYCSSVAFTLFKITFYVLAHRTRVTPHMHCSSAWPWM